MASGNTQIDLSISSLFFGHSGCFPLSGLYILLKTLWDKHLNEPLYVSFLWDLFLSQFVCFFFSYAQTFLDVMNQYMSSWM